MQTSNIKENGFETLIVDYLVNSNHYEPGTNNEYSKDFAIDELRLFRFLNDTQADFMKELKIGDGSLEKTKFLTKLSDKLKTAGVIEVLRNGLRYKHLKLFFYAVTPSKDNPAAVELYSKNIFSVTRQLMYSNVNNRLALDFVIFLNGLPIITFELKNQLTKQSVKDAVHQYRTDRDPNEKIFNFKRCMVHFAVDDNEIEMCTELTGAKSWFLPFNKGYNDGAGNPPNPNGIKTDYLWKEILVKEEISNILENYAQVIEEVDEDTKKHLISRYFLDIISYRWLNRY